MSEVNDFQFKVILQCEQEEFNPTRKQYCEYLVEMNGVERPLRDILKENIEQQATLSALKDIFKDIITYSEWDSKKPYCSLGIAVDRKTYYKIREILNE